MWKNRIRQFVMLRRMTQVNKIIAKVVMSKYLFVLMCVFFFTKLHGYCEDVIVTISNNVNVIRRNNEDACYITRSPKAWGNITIPYFVDFKTGGGYKVKGIEDEAFMGSNVESVTYEGRTAFEIGKSVFKNCRKLTSFSVTPYTYRAILQNYVTGIGAEAFAGCEKLSDIDFSPLTRMFVGDRAFSGCVSLTSIPDEIIEYSCGDIGDYVFENCNGLSEIGQYTGSISIPGKGMFKGCKGLKHVFWPYAVIPEETFADCPNLSKLTGFDFREAIQIKSHAFENCTSLSNLDEFLSKVKSVEIGDSAFCNCSKLEQIKEGVVKNIGNGAFENCTSLKFIPTADDVINWGASAFRNCKNLTSISIPNSLKSIENSTFEGCVLLPTIQIPHSVKYIGSGAFKDCRNIASIWIPNSVVEVGDNIFENVYPKLVAVPCNVFNQIHQDSISSVVMQDPYSDYLYNASSNLSFIDFSKGVDAIASYAFYGIGDVALHLPTGVKSYADDFLRESNVMVCNIPKDMHEWKYDLPNANVTFFVETDSLYMAIPLREGDKMIGVNNSSNVKIVIKDTQSMIGGKWYGNFSYYTENGEELSADITPEKNGLEDRTLELYDLLRVGSIVRDSTISQSEAFYNKATDKRSTLYKTLGRIYPFTDLMSMPLQEFQALYNSLDIALNDALNISSSDFNSLKVMKLDLQNLYDRCTNLYSSNSNIFPYIDANAIASFESAINNAHSSIGEISDHMETITALHNLQTSYNAIVPIINQYNEILQNSKSSLQPLFDESSKLSNTYSNVFPYIDADKKNAFTTSLSEAGKALDGYDNEKVVTAQTNLQTAYDTIVVVINRYNTALSECKNQLQTLVDSCNKIGKTAYADIYPYIDNTAKSAFSTALTTAQSETVKQTYDVKRVQSALTQLQSAYDQVMTLINTYNNDLTTAKQTLQQLIDTEGTLKSKAEYSFIDASLQKTYENALNTAVTTVSGANLTAINSAANSLHQAYVNASKAINSVTNELAPAKSVLQSQIDKGNAYLEDKPYYFTAEYVTKIQSKVAEANGILSGADISSVRQEILAFYDLFEDVDADIAVNKAKVSAMNARFDRIYALMDTLKTIGLYDANGDIIHPAGDIKGMSQFQFDGTIYSYSRCVEVVQQTQRLSAYAGPSVSGFDESRLNDYVSKCNDFIDRFNAEFSQLEAKYQSEKKKLQEAVQRMQQLKEDNPKAYAAIDNTLKAKVEAKLSEWNVDGYAEVGAAYANADFSICNQLQQAIDAYNAIADIPGVKDAIVPEKYKYIYDINGRPIHVNDLRELMPGVYIIDGKKVVVK